MTLRVGINGFGRIGRLVARAIFESDRTDIEVVGINDPGGNFFPLLKYDSIHGKAPFSVERDGEDWIVIDGVRIRRFRNRNIENVHWNEVDVDIVMECTGKFNTDRGTSLGPRNSRPRARRTRLRAGSPPCRATSRASGRRR